LPPCYASVDIIAADAAPLFTDATPHAVALLMFGLVTITILLPAPLELFRYVMLRFTRYACLFAARFSLLPSFH